MRRVEASASAPTPLRCQLFSRNRRLTLLLHPAREHPSTRARPAGGSGLTSQRLVPRHTDTPALSLPRRTVTRRGGLAGHGWVPHLEPAVTCRPVAPAGLPKTSLYFPCHVCTSTIPVQNKCFYY